MLSRLRKRSAAAVAPPPDPDATGAQRLRIFRSILAALPAGRLADLGTGHGKFALAAAELGWRVTGVDARTARMPRHEGVAWVEADVRELDLAGYDCIAILGLLYHLEVDDQLDLLRRAAGTLTIVDTHVALQATHRERGYEGRTFGEQLDAPTASWGNRSSFWPVEPSLVAQFHDAGFECVFKHVPEYRPDRTFWVLR